MPTLAKEENLICRYAMAKAKNGVEQGNNTDPTNIITDLKGNANLTWYNAAFNISDGYDGNNIVGNPSVFVSDGVDTYGQSDASPLFQLNSFSVGFWLYYKTPVEPFECLFALHDGTISYGKILLTNGGWLRFYPNANAAGEYISIPGLVDGALYYIGCTYNDINGFTGVSINGGTFASEIKALTILSYTNDPTIRMLKDPTFSGREYACKLIEMQLYDIPLSELDFLQNYNAGYVWSDNSNSSGRRGGGLILGTGLWVGNSRRRVKNELLFNPDFVTTWETTIVDESITLPLTNHGSYDAVVDWGDGSQSTITSYNQPEITHIYSNPGIHTVTISGTLGGWSFHNSGDKLKIKSVENWGNNVWDHFYYAFAGCSNLISNSKDVPKLSPNATDLQSSFYNCPNFSQNFDNWDVSNVESFWGLFLQSGMQGSVKNWELNNTNVLDYIFSNTPFTGSLASWDVTGVTDSNFYKMFENSGMTTENYDATLISWNQQGLSGKTIYFGNSQYSVAGAAARQALIDRGCTIIDGGSV